MKLALVHQHCCMSLHVHGCMYRAALNYVLPVSIPIVHTHVNIVYTCTYMYIHVHACVARMHAHLLSHKPIPLSGQGLYSICTKEHEITFAMLHSKHGCLVRHSIFWGGSHKSHCKKSRWSVVHWYIHGRLHRHLHVYTHRETHTPPRAPLHTCMQLWRLNHQC